MSQVETVAGARSPLECAENAASLVMESISRFEIPQVDAPILWPGDANVDDTTRLCIPSRRSRVIGKIDVKGPEPPPPDSERLWIGDSPNIWTPPKNL